MIEVIKQGEIQLENIPHKVTCDNCGCVFTHTKEDCWWYSAICTYFYKMSKLQERH